MGVFASSFIRQLEHYLHRVYPKGNNLNQRDPLRLASPLETHTSVLLQGRCYCGRRALTLLRIGQMNDAGQVCNRGGRSLGVTTIREDERRLRNSCITLVCHRSVTKDRVSVIVDRRSAANTSRPSALSSKSLLLQTRLATTLVAVPEHKEKN